MSSTFQDQFGAANGPFAQLLSRFGTSFTWSGGGTITAILDVQPEQTDRDAFPGERVTRVGTLSWSAADAAAARGDTFTSADDAVVWEVQDVTTQNSVTRADVRASIITRAGQV